jgi:acyl-CoA thioesterase
MCLTLWFRFQHPRYVELVNQTFPRTVDVETLGLQFDAGGERCRFELVPQVGRHDGTLYGGTAIAVSIAAMEAASSRPALWATTQYISTAQLGATIECTAELLANGRNISQLQVTGRHGDRVLFMTLGSTATPRPDGLAGQYQAAPHMTSPEQSGPLSFGPPSGFRGFTFQVEYREAKPLAGEATPPPLALWARLTEDRHMTPAGLAFVADMVPGAIARSAGKIGGGVSLDNSLRFADIPSGINWVLLDLRAQMASGAHAHGSVAVWSREGQLLAVGGQSAKMTHMIRAEDLDAPA